MFTVRRVVDEDGRWASTLQASVPADSIELLWQGDPSMDDATEGAEIESLWAGLNAVSGVLVELVYTSPSGVYVRSSGAWHRMPDEDISLDGLESIDVSGTAIDAFDEAEKADRTLTRDEILSHAVDQEAE